MDRIKSFDATGVAPNGVLYAGDLNAIQDAAAELSDFTQHIDLLSVSVGESGLQLLRYGSGEAHLTGRLRTTGYTLALGGIMPGAFTTTTRDAIPVGQRPTNLIIKNTTTGTFQYNAGSDGAPSWVDLVSTVPGDIVARSGVAQATKIGLVAGGLGGGIEVNGDTYLYRIGAGNWKASGTIEAANLLMADGGGSGVVMMGNRGPSGKSGLTMRSDSLVNLYADSATVLKTDNAFEAVGNITLGGALLASQRVSGSSFAAARGADLTVSGNAVTVTNGFHRITTNAGAANLSQINGLGSSGEMLWLHNATGVLFNIQSGGNIDAVSFPAPVAVNALKLLIYNTATNKWQVFS